MAATDITSPARGGAPRRARAALCAAAAVGVSLLASAVPSRAVLIPATAVGKDAVEESFEGLVIGPQVSAQAGMSGVLLPGVSGPYTFASGVTLFGPNTYVFPNDAFVHELAQPAPPNDWGANGVVDDSGDVPFGTAYLGVFEAGTAESEVRLAFSAPVQMVGAFVAGAAGTTITLEAYDAAGTLLESATIAAPSVAAWGDSFLGLSRTEGIASVVFRGHDFGIDGLYFDMAAVPEPHALGLLGLALLWLLARRQQRHRPA